MKEKEKNSLSSSLSLLAPVVSSPGCRRNALEVLLRARHIRLDRLGPRLPPSGAHLAVLVRELKGLDEPQSFVDGAADGQVVDGDLAEDSRGRDDEEAAEGDAGVVALVCLLLLVVGERKEREKRRES